MSPRGQRLLSLHALCPDGHRSIQGRVTLSYLPYVGGNTSVQLYPNAQFFLHLSLHTPDSLPSRVYVHSSYSSGTQRSYCNHSVYGLTPARVHGILYGPVSSYPLARLIISSLCYHTPCLYPHFQECTVFLHFEYSDTLYSPAGSLTH